MLKNKRECVMQGCSLPQTQHLPAASSGWKREAFSLGLFCKYSNSNHEGSTSITYSPPRCLAFTAKTLGISFQGKFSRTFRPSRHTVVMLSLPTLRLITGLKIMRRSSKKKLVTIQQAHLKEGDRPRKVVIC